MGHAFCPIQARCNYKVTSEQRGHELQGGFHLGEVVGSHGRSDMLLVHKFERETAPTRRVEGGSHYARRKRFVQSDCLSIQWLAQVTEAPIRRYHPDPPRDLR